MREPSRGFALLAVLLALVILTGLLHGTLMLARFQGFAGQAETRVLQARLAAQSGVRLVESDLDDEDREALIAGDTVLTRVVSLGGRTRSRVSVRRLAPEWYWVEAEGRAGLGAGQGLRRLAAVYWSLEAVRRVEALRATAEVGEEVVTSATSAITPLVGGAADPGYAAGVCGAITGPGSGTTVPSVGMMEPSTVELVDASISVPALTSGLSAIPRLGLLDGDALALRVGPMTRISGTPPSAFRVVDGSHSVPAEGFGGLLALSGDLELLPGRELAGLVLVGGSLTVRDGARILGAVRVRGSVTVEGSGAIVGSPCTVLKVLRDLPGLSAMLSAPDGTWIDLP